MATSFNKAGIVRGGLEATTSEHDMRYEMSGEKTQLRKRAGGVSNPNVRVRETQGDNAENALFSIKKTVSDNNSGLTTFSRPLTSARSVATSVAKSQRQPDLALFKSLAKKNDIEKIIGKLQGVDINQRMENGVTILEEALHPKTLPKLAQALIKMGARFDLLETRHYGIVHSATVVGDRGLLSHVLNNVVTDDSKCPDLFLSDDSLSPSLLARVDMHNAFYHAIGLHRYGQWRDLALDLKKSIGTIDPSHLDVQEAFHRAVESSHLEIIKWLWDTGRVDVNIRNEYGVPLLSVAVMNSAKDVIEFLLSKGASVTPSDNHAVCTVLNSPGNVGIGVEEKCDKERIEILNMLFNAKDVSIDFTEKISVGDGRSCTLYELAAEAGTDFLNCVANAQLRQASKRTDVPLYKLS